MRLSFGRPHGASGLRPIREEEGAAALEFALITPVLLLLVMGIIEFGFAFQAQLALTHAAREGARLATVGRYDAATVVSRAYPLTPTIVTIPADVSTATSGDPVTVTLSYDYDWQVLPIPGTITIHGTAVMRRE